MTKITNRHGNIITPSVGGWKNINSGDDEIVPPEVEVEITEADFKNIHLFDESRFNDFWLQVEQTNGSTWEVPAKLVAENRANYFSDIIEGDGIKKEMDCFAETFNETIKDNELLIDWAEQNMDWSEVSDFARLRDDPNRDTDFDEGWLNGMKQVVDYCKFTTG